MKKKFEYRKLEFDEGNVNALGSEGWRVIGILGSSVIMEKEYEKEEGEKTDSKIKIDEKTLKKFCKLLCIPAYTYGESFGDIMRNEKETSDAFRKYLLENNEEFYKQMVNFGYNDAPGYVEEGNDDKAFTEALKCAVVTIDNYYGKLDEEIMLRFVEFLLINKKIKEQFINDIQESINELNGSIEDVYELFKTHSELIDTFNEFKKV